MISPIDGAAVHQGREHTQPSAEGVPNRAQAQNHVQIGSSSFDEESVDLGRGSCVDTCGLCVVNAAQVPGVHVKVQGLWRHRSYQRIRPVFVGVVF